MPPVATVSTCDPHMTGGPSSRPGRVPTTLPMASMATSRPASPIHIVTRSRPSRSASVRAKREQPPPSRPPIWPSSWSRRTSRLASTRRVAVSAIVVIIPR